MLFFLLLNILAFQSTDSQNLYLEKYFIWQSKGFSVYTDSVILDYDNGLAFYVEYFGNIPVDTYNILPLSYYIDSLRNDVLYKEYLSITPESAKATAQSSGLIPTIDLPIRFPKQLSFLGNGGKLDIRGGEDVIIGGQSTYLHNPSMGADTGSSFPTLNLESSMRVLLTGTVGSKLHITLDYDQKRENQNKNIIRLKYTGDEDEVVQSIEAGQTSFSIQGTQFASFAGGGGKSGLFGLKGILNVAGVNVQAVLTRETGESSQGTFVGGAREDTLVLYDKDYLKNKFYYINEPDSIVRIYVLVHDGSGVQGGEIYHCVAYYYDPQTTAFDSALVEDTRFKLLEEQTDFLYYPSSKILELKNPVEEGNIVAVSYMTSNGRWVGDALDSSFTSYTLRLIRPSRYMNNTDTLYTRADTLKTMLFALELKNIYPINFYGMSEYEGLSIDDIILTIYKDSLGSNIWKSAERGKTYLQLLGLDNNGDGKIDPTVTVNGRILQVFDGVRKYLIFPQPYPFMSDSLEDPDSIIYKKPQLNTNEGQKYKLVFLRRAHLERVIALGAMDIVEGSEVVKYNGRVLSRNRDYTVDYTMGTITLLDTSILNDPTAKIEINYEYSPFFQTKSKSLYGFRATYGREDLRLGSTFLGRSESSQDRRPKISQEPVKNTVIEGDFQVKKQLSFLSSLLSTVTWKSQSGAPEFRIQGEVARSFPNLNTEGYGYIDDMDNSKKTGSIYLSYTYWKYGSRPVFSDNTYASLNLLCDEVSWYTFTNIFSKGDVYDNLESDEARQPATVLAIKVKPHNQDTTSYASLSQLLDDRGNSWNDMEYLEVIVKGDRGKIHIDLGSYISEDAIWRDRNGNIKGWHHDSLSVIDTEDKNGDGQWIASNEDTGLDGVYGDDNNWGPSSKDDGNDDYKGYDSRTGDWSHVNGTEHNGRFDTEELKVDGILDTTNDYFEYVVDLSDTNSPILKSINSKGFRHYLIPFRDLAYYRKVGNPYFENIRVARIWIDGITEEETYIFAKLEVVGSRWQKIGIFTVDSSQFVDSTEEFGVRTVSISEDPAYTTPPGVYVERDPLTGQLATERSLGLSYKNLKTGHYALVRYYSDLSQSQNLLGYRTLNLFIKPSPSTMLPYPEFEIRIGDTVNYYVYRFKIESAEWQEINIPLDSLSRYKMYVQDSLKEHFSQDSFYTDGVFGFKGSPNLRAVRNYDFVIFNTQSQNITGEVWIDELRLKDPRNEHGTAYSLRGKVNFGSLFNASYNITKKDESFKTFSQNLTQFNNSSQNINYQLSFRPSMFLPPNWGINMQTSYSRTKNIQLPRYKPNTDVILDTRQKEQNKTLSLSERYSIQYSKQRSKNALLNIFFDPFTLSASRSKNRSSSPTAINENLSNAASLGYSYAPNVNFKVLGHTIMPLPSRIAFGASYAFGESKSNDIYSHVERRDSNKALAYNYSLDFRPFTSVSARFSRNMTRDFYWDTLKFYKYGKLNQITQNFNLSYNVNFLGIARPNLSFTSAFSQRFDKNLQSDTLSDVSNINNSGTFSMQTNLDLRKIFGKILREEKHGQSDTVLMSPLEYLASNIRKLSNYFSSPGISYTQNQQSNYQYVIGKVGKNYMLGLDFEPDIKSLLENQRTWGKNRNISANESFNLPFGNLRLMYTWNEARNYTYTQEQITKQITWPQITFSLNQVFLKPLVGKGKYIENPSLSITYNIKRQTQGLKDEPLRSVSGSVTLNPQMSLRLLKKIGVNGGYNFTKQVDTSLVGTPQETSTKRGALNFSASYSFRSPQGLKIPGIGRLKLKNEVTITLSYSRNTTNSERTNINTGEATPITDNVSSTLNLSASYNFSRDITGTLTFSRGGNEDVIHAIKTINTNLNIKASFRF